MVRSLWYAMSVLFGCVTGIQGAVVVSPASVKLDRPEASQQLLVSLPHLDATRTAKYAVADAKIVQVDSFGMVTPLAEGQTEISITVGNETAKVPVRVEGLKSPRRVSFEHEIIPVLTKSSCNSGGCHGKAEGQAGFKLSVFGFDPAADHEALVNDGRGRRIFPASPESSLLLAKGTGAVPHGGGKKIDKGTLRYRRLLRWLEEGATFEGSPVAPVVSIEVEPSQRTLALNGSQQLRVTAIAADGSRRCVTAEAEYDTNASTIAGADSRGLISAGDKPGEAGILVRYMGHVTVCRITLPKPGVKFQRPPEANFIDKHVWDKLERLGIPPSELADDAMFLRRAFLDTIGTLPTASETAAFLDDRSADKRSKLVDGLLNRPEYADYWAMKWSDILKVDKDAVTPQGAVAMSRWIRKQFAENRRFDAVARDIVTAKGNTTSEGPAALYKSLGTSEIAARSISQVFLGVRIECAECHHHPSEKWSQDDYWALAGMFSGVTRKPLPGGAEAVVWKNGVDLGPKVSKKANGLQTIPARPLGGVAKSFQPSEDRRTVLADWMVAKENPFFAPAIANRLWSHFFGRGLVEPLDDMRATNPATNEPLLVELASHLKEKNFDLKALIKTLLLSRAYQLSSRTLPENMYDEQNFSHATIKPLPAEVLLDAVSHATGVPEKFNGWPEGYRAIQIWDNRMPSYFFHIFGRPVRFSVCECERGTDPSIAQALHLMNSPEIAAKIRSRTGLARRLADSDKTPAAIVDELFLTSLNRRPTEAERKKMADAFVDSDRRQTTEDVLWVLLNSKEFLFNR